MADKQINLIINAILKDKKFKAGVKGMSAATAKAEKTQTSFLKKIRLGWLAVGAVLTGTVAVAFKKVTKLASDFEEQNAKFLTVFKGVEKRAEEMARTLEASFGVSVIESRKFLSAVQDLFIPLGFARDTAAEMSFEVVKLASDLASFNNLPTATVMRDIESALVGNFETMKKYGVVLNETILKQKALEEGFKLVNGRVDAQDKAFLALKIITENSKDAIGDFARTSRSLANQTKILTANLTNMGVKIGQKLAPTVNSILNDVNDWFDRSGDLDSITEKLIGTQTEYNTVVKKLADDTGIMADNERRALEIRERILKIKIVQFINKEREALEQLNGEGKRSITFAGQRKRDLEDQERLLKRQQKELEETGRITIETEMGIKTIRASRKTLDFQLDQVQRKLLNTGNELDEMEIRRSDTINTLASNIRDGIITREQLIVLDDITKTQIEERILLLEKENEAVTTNLDIKTDATTQELDLEALKLQAAQETVKEREKLVKKIMKLEIEASENIKDASVKDLEAILQKHKDVEELREEISQTFVDGFLGGVEDMKSGSKSILISMVKQFTSFIAGKLAASAILHFTNPFTIPRAIAETAGAAAVKIAGSAVASKIDSFAVGTNVLLADTIAQLHKGERVVPASMNIPQLSNEAFSAAAMQGISGIVGGGNVVNNNNTDNVSNTANNTFNVPAGTVGMDEIMEFAERTNAQILQR
ncbi:MAG TPA: hypothetical protein ENH82_17945 [bacterium]|nr:hypothetical protein [bacterium]